MIEDPFTPNKRKVRELNLRLIQRHFEARKGTLRYFGLPAPSMQDIALWDDYLEQVVAVERGRTGEEYKSQHNLMLTAFQMGIANKVSLLRGDIDDILLKGKDENGNIVDYPFDVVTLDYSGGLLYQLDKGWSARTESIAELIRRQAECDQDFILLISCNMDNHDAGQIRQAFEDIRREMEKLGVNVSDAINSYLRHERQEARLKVYIPYLVQNLAAAKYLVETSKSVCYVGNRSTRMMNFSFWLQRSNQVAGRFSRQTLVGLLNLSVFECVEGALTETHFDIPQVEIATLN